MSKVCTDCFFCKINRSEGWIRCIVPVPDDEEKTFSYWEKSNGLEKIVSLNFTETVRPFIKWRDLFRLAKRCPSMKSMS